MSGVLDHYPTDDKIDLNSRFESLDSYILNFGTNEECDKWNNYLGDNGYDGHKCLWSESWLSSTIDFGEKLMGIE